MEHRRKRFLAPTGGEGKGEGGGRSRGLARDLRRRQTDSERVLTWLSGVSVLGSRYVTQPRGGVADD